MKTTIDIPDQVLEDVLKHTGARTKREAVITALEDFNRRRRMARLVKYSGSSGTLMANDDIEQLEAAEITLPYGSD